MSWNSSGQLSIPGRIQGLVDLGAGYMKALVFVIAMILGMLLHDQAYLKVKQHFLQQTS